MRYLMITSFQQDISYDKIGFFAKKKQWSWKPQFHCAKMKTGWLSCKFWALAILNNVQIPQGRYWRRYLVFSKDGAMPNSQIAIFFVNIIFPTVSCPKKCSIFSPMAYKNLKKMLVTPTYFRHWVCVSPWSNWQGICTQIFIGDVARNGW